MAPFPVSAPGLPVYAPIPMSSYSRVIPTSLNIPKSKVPAKAPPPPHKGGGDSSDGSDWDSGSEADEGAAQERIQQALQWFNDATEEQIVEVISMFSHRLLPFMFHSQHLPLH